MAFALNSIKHWQLYKALGIALCFGVLLIGCGGGGGDKGGVGLPFGVPAKDLHGDIPFEATRIFVDGEAIVGAINPGTADPVTGANDTDWFKYTAVEGVTYVIQLSGFTTRQPALTKGPQDFTDDRLEVMIVMPDGGTQLLNSTGSHGGSPNDVDPAGFPIIDGVAFGGDSRILWLCPLSGQYYIRLRHRIKPVGTGNYVFSIASAQLYNEDYILPSSPRILNTFLLNEAFVDPIDPDGLNYFFSPVSLSAQLFRGLGLEVFLERTGAEFGWFFFVGFPSFFSETVTFPENDDPETPALHIHAGFPNEFHPPLSFNFTDGDDPHNFIVEITDDPEILPALDAFRTITGFPWYMDVHFTTDYEAWPNPIAVSPPNGGIYGVFETPLQLRFSNVVTRDAEHATELNDERESRGIITDNPFDVYYDTSLHTFQIARNLIGTEAIGGILGLYQGFTTPTVLPATSDLFANLPITVRAGGPGEVGPVIIDLGTIPPPITLPACPTCPDAYQYEDSGFRNVVKQLNDVEVEDLRNAFYGGGFYVQVDSPSTPNGLLRAEGHLGIQTFPNDGTRQAARNPGSGKGTINFASSYSGGGQVTVISNGKIIGVLNDFIAPDATPDCGAMITSESLAAEYLPGEYFYRAFSEDGTEWKGHFTIEPGGCETVVMSME